MGFINKLITGGPHIVETVSNFQPEAAEAHHKTDATPAAASATLPTRPLMLLQRVSHGRNLALCGTLW